MTPNASPQFLAVTALGELLLRVPELGGAFKWTMTPDGRLLGERELFSGDPSLIDRCAAVINGTPAITTYSRDGDLVRVTEVQATWRDTPFDVWESASAPGSDVAERFRALFAATPDADPTLTGGDH